MTEQIEEVETYSGVFHFDDEEEALQWCEDSSFVDDETVETFREIVESPKTVRSITVDMDIPSDMWTGYCQQEPEDVQIILGRVEE